MFSCEFILYAFFLKTTWGQTRQFPPDITISSEKWKMKIAPLGALFLLLKEFMKLVFFRLRFRKIRLGLSYCDYEIFHENPLLGSYFQDFHWHLQNFVNTSNAVSTNSEENVWFCLCALVLFNHKRAQSYITSSVFDFPHKIKLKTFVVVDYCNDRKYFYPDNLTTSPKDDHSSFTPKWRTSI